MDVEISYGDVFPRLLENQILLTICNEQSKFHLGQSYDKKPATPLKCLKCGGNQFNIAEGSHYTAIRCPKCEWECCIHDG